MVFTVDEVLQRLRPGASWEVANMYDYETLTWNDENEIKPTRDEYDSMIREMDIERMWKCIRERRDMELSKTDKYIVADYPHATPEIKQAWLDYRQALRDLPANTTDPENPVWPTPPN
jgi:uncharacterized protein (DUF433 family)